MKRVTLTLLALLVFVATVGLAQEDAQYSAWMKSVGASQAAIRTAIAAKDNAAVATEANKLAATFDTIANFWKEKKKDDAVKFATTARDAAKSIATATDDAAQTAALRSLNPNCQGCHAQYRDGNKFKNL